MDIIENIVHYFQNKKDTDKDSSPEGTCPVCWGYQQYDEKIRVLLKDKQIDINNHKDSYTLVQGFMKHHVDGVKLKDSIEKECPNCADKKEQD